MFLRRNDAKVSLFLLLGICALIAAVASPPGRFETPGVDAAGNEALKPSNLLEEGGEELRHFGPRVDAVGDPLPEGALARIGTVRLRQPSEVCSVAFSPDGKLLATGGRYDGVRLWDSTTGKAIRFLPAKGGQGIFHLSFSPDGNVLVSSGFDGALEVLEVATGKKTHQLGKDSEQLGPLCFSDDGKLLAVADGPAMRVWETADWAEQQSHGPEGGKVVFPSFIGKRMYVDRGRITCGISPR
jgi:WD40 repeat protein